MGAADLLVSPGVLAPFLPAAALIGAYVGVNVAGALALLVGMRRV